MLVLVPEQIDPEPPTVKPIAGKGLIVTEAVCVSCDEQPVDVMVASILKVVFEDKFPVGRLMGEPFPATAVPTFVLLASRN